MHRWIKIITPIIFMLVHIQAGCTTELFTQKFDAVLHDHVSEGIIQGITLNMVDYQSIQKDPRYQALIEDLHTIHVDNLTGPEKMAFWINTYNVCAIKMVLDHYPVTSIKDIGGFFQTVWDTPVIIIRTDEYTLGEIEHSILRPMGDPRIHCAIVCASLSCPNLRKEAYTPENLDEQLDDQVRKFLNNETKGAAFKDSALRVSAIFKWFDEDFEAYNGVRGFLKKYLSSEKQEQLSETTTIRYLPYDWSLNNSARVEKKNDID
ncbi:MAG: DUF547 domain-containing protein [Elusimicrobia bacterium]|nr:DUF547 domain-containing protein [Elusimicrobiota bacterium]